MSKKLVNVTKGAAAAEEMAAIEKHSSALMVGASNSYASPGSAQPLGGRMPPPSIPPTPVIRYAKTDEEICAIHRFLLIVAQPAMRCPVDIVKSLNEIIRVAKEEAAIMVMHGATLVGTMGLIKARWWYGSGEFMTDRWHFVLPQLMHTPTAAALMNDARTIAATAGLEFIHQGKIRGEKSSVLRMMPTVYEPATMAAGG